MNARSSTPPRLGIFAATSGHSGVDRVLGNLIPEFASQGVLVDVLHVRDHGPFLDVDTTPPGVRMVELGSAHVATSLYPLIRYLRKERPAALLSDKDKVNRVALAARWLARSPTRVVVRMGTTVSKNLERRSALDRWIQYTSLRLFYHFADGIVTPSQGAADDLAQIARLASSRVSVVPSPVVTADLTRLSQIPPQHPWLRDKTSPVILGVGELSARKDFATLLRAFAQLRAQRACRLVIYGEGRQRETLLALAKALGVQSDIDLPGFTSNPYAEMAAADVFALTSICEGSPVVLMEALAVGTPAIATDSPSGPREILDGGRYGPLVAVGDVDALATGLAQLLDQPTSRMQLQQAAQRYTAAASARRYLEVLGLAEHRLVEVSPAHGPHPT
jgi:glycosyltransferase involved in cell wall biosynthesis